MKKIELNNFCEVDFDGRKCVAKVTHVNNQTQVFSVVTSFGEPMYNIPFDKFTESPNFGTLIINMLNAKYNLDLMTIDSFSMSEDINILAHNKKWMLNL